MSIIHAIYENGVFRPTEPVELPDKCRVEFVPKVVEDETLIQAKIEELRKTNPALADVYEVLSHRHRSGCSNTAERHNEHQP